MTSARSWIWLVVVLTAALLITLFYRDDHRRLQTAALDTLHVPAGCDPQSQPCVAGGEPTALVLRFPDKVRLMAPFPVEVRLQGATAAAVVVAFEMRDMDMGVNRTALALGDDGVWRGEAVLPICRSGRADWQAVVEAQSEAGVLRARYGFEVAP